MNDSLEELRYPIGRFEKPETVSNETFNVFIEIIEKFPERISAAVADLSTEQLDTHYRPEGWTIRQVVHHCADSHMNGITRTKLALTEVHPTIKPYREELWAELNDSKHHPIEVSLQLIEAVHERWTKILKSLTPTDRQRTFIHPEHFATFTINQQIAQYSWHCEHHLTHITRLKDKMCW